MDVKYDRGTKLVFKFVKRVFPEVDKELKQWVDISARAGDEMLGRQALASISHKRFHAQGGSIYALYPGVQLHDAVKFIVALQTISDYLDNLCDRAGVRSEQAFRQLHLALTDAVDPGKPVSDYYLYYPYKNDNQYLLKLVEACRMEVSKLPSYLLVKEAMIRYVRLYSDLQTYKHLDLDIRDTRMICWANEHLSSYPDITCWEFAAATGSTLGMFMLFAVSADPTLSAAEVQAIDKVYFPWICGLHILLDYYIDTVEDRDSGDLNFTFYYEDLRQCEERLAFFIDSSLQHCNSLKYPKFHTTVVKGLLAMYLSDSKALEEPNNPISQRLLKRGGGQAGFFYRLCRGLRSMGKI